jgi:hypothetical protein
MTVRLELKMLIHQCYKSSVACNKLACFFSKIIESSYQGTIVGLLDQVELETACGSSTVSKHSPHDHMVKAGKSKREKYHCTVDLLFDWFGISCKTPDNFCFYLQNRLIQTSQTGGQLYSDTSLFSIPWARV